MFIKAQKNKHDRGKTKTLRVTNVPIKITKNIHLSSFQLFLLVDFNQLDFGSLQQVEHPLICTRKINSVGGTTGPHHHLGVMSTSYHLFIGAFKIASLN